MKHFLLLIALLLTGCARQKIINGIPNFNTVGPGVYRGAQPLQGGWAVLKSLGVTNVVKLNLESEGSDAEAVALGMTVQRFPITTEQQIFGNGLDAIIPKAVAAINPGTFVHCGSDSRTRSELDARFNTQGGQDRTGLVCAEYRILTGWSKADAEKEMMANGFHPELLGLLHYFKESTP